MSASDDSIGNRWACNDSPFLPHEAYVIRAYTAYMATHPVRQPPLLNTLAEPCELGDNERADGVRVTLRSLDMVALAVYVFSPGGRMRRVS